MQKRHLQTTTPRILCCARTRIKLSRLLVGESVRIIEGSLWQPYTSSLSLKSGSLGVMPTILRFGNRDFKMRSSPCVNGNVALCSSHFFHARFHGRKQQSLIRSRFGSKIDLFPCRTSSEKNRVAPILGSIKHGASFIKIKRPVIMFCHSCRHHLSRSRSRSFHTFRRV